MDSPVIFPKMVFFRSRWSQRSSVMKNWLLLVWGAFLLAHATSPLQTDVGALFSMLPHFWVRRCASACMAHLPKECNCTFIVKGILR